MAAVQRHELEELANRLDWMDEERRKSTRQVSRLEQQVNQQERIIANREKRIKELEAKLTDTTLQLNRVSQIDTTLQQFKDELVELIEDYEKRQSRTAEEAERMHRVENEMLTREIADIRKQLPEIGRLRQDMELRQAEESRLANLIGKLQTKIPPLENRIDKWERDLAFIGDSERQWAKSVTDLESSIESLKQRVDPIFGRMDMLNNTVMKTETEIQKLSGLQEEVRQTIKSWVDQIQLGEYERNQRVQKWEGALDEYKNRMENFAKEWIRFSDQYKEAQMAVQTLTDWQRQFEQQQREASELMRVEVNRMQTRWDNFLADIEKRWRNFEVDQDQRLADGLRRDKGLEGLIHDIQESIKQLESERDTLWRVQTAQLDAIKQIPRVWLEEVEKARQRDPNRRREPSLVPVEDDLY